MLLEVPIPPVTTKAAEVEDVADVVAGIETSK
jgi:hypothetical protein